MTDPLPFADDDEAEAEYRATRHQFDRPRRTRSTFQRALQAVQTTAEGYDPSAA